MKTIFWNSQGLIAPDKRRRLRMMIRDHDPWIIAICETHIEVLEDSFTRYLEGNRRRHWLCSSSSGQSGGIILSWVPGNITQVQYWIDRHSIRISYLNTSSGKQALFAAIHMPCDRISKDHVRQNLSNWIDTHLCDSCLLVGDFNATTSLSERYDCIGDTQDSEAFVDWINYLAFTDLGFSEPLFTWKHGSRLVRLDRFLASSAWIDDHPCFEPSSLHFNGSDHRPIMCSVLQSFTGSGGLASCGRLTAEVPIGLNALTLNQRLTDWNAQ